MKFVVDQQLPATLGDWFEKRGFEATHVRELGMRDAPDSAIWRYAQNQGAVIVTKDEDFAFRRSMIEGPQILWLRIGNSTNAALRSYLDAVWPDVQRWLEAGEPIVEA